jgi:hypothetical protein
MWLVPCFLRAAYTTALHPFAMGGPRTKLQSPTGSSSFVTSVLLHSVFEIFHCIRDTASCEHDMTFIATFKFHNNFEHMSTYILELCACNFVYLTYLNAPLHTMHAWYNTADSYLQAFMYSFIQDYNFTFVLYGAQDRNQWPKMSLPQIIEHWTGGKWIGNHLKGNTSYYPQICLEGQVHHEHQS